jgi:hypothetical protein
MGDRIKLTKRQVDWIRAHPADEERVWWDAEVARFGLRKKAVRPDTSSISSSQPRTLVR